MQIAGVILLIYWDIPTLTPESARQHSSWSARNERNVYTLRVSAHKHCRPKMHVPVASGNSTARGDAVRATTVTAGPCVSVKVKMFRSLSNTPLKLALSLWWGLGLNQFQQSWYKRACELKSVQQSFECYAGTVVGPQTEAVREQAQTFWWEREMWACLMWEILRD